MAFRWARQGLVVAFLVAAAGSAAPQVQSAAPPRPVQPATPPNGQPGSGQAGGGQAQQLGRPYIRGVPPPPPRKSPQVHVSVVSPQQSSSNVFQHIGQQRGRGTGGFGGGGGMGGMGTGGMGGMGTGGGMGSGFPAR
jgi:hypothetical protein